MAGYNMHRVVALLALMALGANAEMMSQAFVEKFIGLKKAHGVIMTVAFGILYPLGAAMVRFMPYKGQVWVHAAIQTVAWMLSISGLGTGIWLAVNSEALKTAHAVIGIIVIGSLSFQLPLGLIHHYAWKGKHRRTIWAYAHLTVGRIMLILGGINGGLGLQLAEDRGVQPAHWMPVYIVLVAVFYSLWIFVAALAVIKTGNRQVEFETGEKLIQLKSRDTSLGSTPEMKE